MPQDTAKHSAIPDSGTTLITGALTGAGWVRWEESWTERTKDAMHQLQIVAGGKDPIKCDPIKCDPIKCDPIKCDPIKCDPIKCDPIKCDPIKCDPLDAIFFQQYV